jgi:NTP pyrophosphatase (non-canonical NTP hydrolase)
MDNTDTIANLRHKVLQFRQARNWEQFHDPKNLAMALAIEAAELQEIFLWKSEAEIERLLGEKTGQEKIQEELADIFIFLLYLTEAANLDLSEAVKAKLLKNETKYPVCKSFGCNKKYTEL